jgi:glycosyltransferase involved in cell wall biosynthesis
MKPIVSIIIPTRNAEKFVGQCLKSINNQIFRDFEVVIVDGQSTDKTLEVAHSLANFKLVMQTGTWLAAAWNQGIQASQGAYIGFIDSDDWFEPDSLAQHMHELLSHPEIDYSIGHVKYFAEDANKLPYGFKPSLLKGIHHALMPGCFVGKRTLFSKVGFFDESLIVATDIQWFHDLKVSHAPSIDLNVQVLNKRIHTNNLSYTTSETSVYNQELLAVVRRRLRLGS